MRVLIVDDTTDIRDLVRFALERAGHQIVGEAANGREAIGIAQTVDIDAVLLDVMMPELNGLEALPHLRRLLPSARIVMFSSVPDAEADARRLGADGFVVKGVRVESLVRAIEGASPNPDD